jgi:hypothetical protein
MGTPGTLRILLLRSRSFAMMESEYSPAGMREGLRTGNDVDAVLLDAVDDALVSVSLRVLQEDQDLEFHGHHRHMCLCGRRSGESTSRRGQLNNRQS